MEEIRLQKYIAEAGIASRRNAEKLITDGRIKVNGAPAELGQKVIPGKDRVTYKGQPVEIKENDRKT